MIDENSAEWQTFKAFIVSHCARIGDVMGRYTKHLTYSQYTGIEVYRLGLDKYLAQARRGTGRREKAIKKILTKAWSMRDDFSPETEAVTQWFDRCCQAAKIKRDIR